MQVLSQTRKKTGVSITRNLPQSNDFHCSCFQRCYIPDRWRDYRTPAIKLQPERGYYRTSNDSRSDRWYETTGRLTHGPAGIRSPGDAERVFSAASGKGPRRGPPGELKGKTHHSHEAASPYWIHFTGEQGRAPWPYLKAISFHITYPTTATWQICPVRLQPPFKRAGVVTHTAQVTEDSVGKDPHSPQEWLSQLHGNWGNKTSPWSCHLNDLDYKLHHLNINSSWGLD